MSQAEHEAERPLQAVRAEGGWSVEIPVRTEVVSVRKRVVVAEQVIIRRGRVTRTEPRSVTQRRERARIESHGRVDLETGEPNARADLDVTEPLVDRRTRRRGAPGATGLDQDPRA